MSPSPTKATAIAGSCRLWILLSLFTLFLLARSLRIRASSEASSHFQVRTEAVDETIRRLDSKKAPPEVQVAAARGVLRRLLPTHYRSFDFRIIPKAVCDGCSCFHIYDSYRTSSMKLSEIIIEGTSAVEIVSGLYWYLKNWCGAHLSWQKNWWHSDRFSSSSRSAASHWRSDCGC